MRKLCILLLACIGLLAMPRHSWAQVPTPTLVVDEENSDPCAGYWIYYITNFNSSYTYTVNVLTFGITPLPLHPTTYRFRIKRGAGITQGTFNVTAASSGSSATSADVTAEFYCNTDRQAAPAGKKASLKQLPTESYAYPNPTADVLTLPEGAESAVLLNSAGLPLRTMKGGSQLEVQALPDGLYTLQVRRNGQVTTQRIQVKH